MTFDVVAFAVVVVVVVVAKNNNNFDEFFLSSLTFERAIILT
jgi:hypothetical protein